MNMLVNLLLQNLCSGVRHAGSLALSAAELLLQKSAGAAGMLAQTQPAPPAPLADPPKVPHSPLFWMPNSASGFSGEIDTLFDFLLWVSTVSLIAIAAAMIYFCVKYRATSREANEAAESQVDHSNTLEVTWSVIPLFVVIAVFVAG